MFWPPAGRNPESFHWPERSFDRKQAHLLNSYLDLQRPTRVTAHLLTCYSDLCMSFETPFNLLPGLINMCYRTPFTLTYRLHVPHTFNLLLNLSTCVTSHL